MKTTSLAAIATIAVVAVLTVGVISLNYALISNPRVEITSFNTTRTSSGSSDGVVNVWFVFNLTNAESGDVKDISVSFSTNATFESDQHLVYSDSAPSLDHIADFTMGEQCRLGDLTAGETKDFMFYWAVSADSNAHLLTATLKSKGVILDQASLTVPPIPNVQITNFVYLGVWHGTRLGGLLDLFSLSYTNLGVSEVENLTVTLSTSKTNDTAPRSTPTSIPGYNPYYLLDEIINGEIYPLESLKAKETKTFEKSYQDVGFLLIEPFDLTATLKINGTILDQETIRIP